MFCVWAIVLITCTVVVHSAHSVIGHSHSNDSSWKLWQSHYTTTTTSAAAVVVVGRHNFEKFVNVRRSKWKEKTRANCKFQLTKYISICRSEQWQDNREQSIDRYWSFTSGRRHNHRNANGDRVNQANLIIDPSYNEDDDDDWEANNHRSMIQTFNWMNKKKYEKKKIVNW